MKRGIIRWPGLAVFTGFVLLLVAISWLFLDAIIKVTLEHTLGRLNGAEVNIERVEHSWSPLALRIKGVQVTNPQQPTHNRVQVGEASADISPTELILGRTLIEQLTMTGIRVNQERDSEGEVYVLPSEEDMKQWAEQSWENLKMSLPSTDEIVAQVDLRTDKVIEESKQTYEQQKQQVLAAKEALPSEDKIKEYEQQLKEITDSDTAGLGDIAARKKAFDELKESIRKDKEAVTNFRERVSEAKDVLQTQVAELKNAPGNDIDRIKSFFSMDGQGLQNVTGLLLGEQAKQWSQYLLLAYEQLGPMLARSDNSGTVEPVRGEGQRISFAEQDAPPEFLIKKARTEFMVAGTVIDVDWQNITHQHNLLGQPTTYQARADNSELWKAFNLNGELSLTDLGIDAKQQWQLKGAQLQNLGLSQSAELSAQIVSSLLDSDGTILVRENKLDGNAMVRMLNLDMDASGSSKLTNAIASALEQLQRLDIATNIAGDIQSPSLSFDSDLDDQLGSLLADTAMAEADGKLADIKADLTAKVSEQLGSQEELLQNLTQWNSESGEKGQKLEELLKSKLEDSLKDKLKGRLFGDS
ncbi:TIGR03545 family protein [Idiomarina piscisalsi]|uniref:TIGR03545 family protein n=1 Tax=Idiomarina piscisalsi TaxID=1096243 RepID=A0ABN5ANG1_9GAMM|nr:TIGR03545 family protein [Idiomarina piscisalsi]ASG65064.1 TIGR03545 family protein [Idiomarina piscisalsi]